MHAKMLFSSIGGLLSPLVLSNFLVDLPETGSKSKCNYINQQPTSMSPSTLITSSTWATALVENENENEDCTVTPDDVALVKWSFLFSSCCMLTPMVLMAITSFSSTSTRILPQSARYDIELASKQKELPKPHELNAVTYLFVGDVTLLAGLFMSMVATISQYLLTFVVTGLHWNVQTSAFLNTVHNGGYIAGRIIGIPLSHFIRTPVLIASSLIMGTVGILIFLLVGLGFLPDRVMWAGVCITGMGKSLVTSCLLIWTNQITGLLTPVQSAALNIGMCVGYMIGPVITSTLYSSYSYMAMVYVALVSNIIQLIVFAVLLIISRRLAASYNSDVVFLNFHMLVL